MPLLLDSADMEDISSSRELEVVSGVTTNPKLMHEAGADPERRIKEILEKVPWPLWIQVPEGRRQEMFRWSLGYWSVAPERIVIKIPCTWDGVWLAGRLKRNHIPVCITTVFTSYQALLAFEAGADYVAPYVNRASREGGDGIELVKDIAEIIRARGGQEEILAASLKSPEELVQAYLAGAQYLTAPYKVLKDLLRSPLTDDALASFRELPGSVMDHKER